MDRDMDGWFEQCLQCSYRKELRDIREFGRQSVSVGGSRTLIEDNDEFHE